MNGGHRVLVLSRHARRYRELLDAAALPGLAWVREGAPGGEVAGDDRDADVLFGEPGLVREALPSCPAVAWVQSTWAGVAPLLGPGCRRDYRLTGVKGVFGPAMAEYVTCYLLMHARHGWARARAQGAGRWDPAPPGTLRGRTVGVMGVGSIGACVARVLKSFGMATRGYTRGSRGCDAIDAYFGPGELLAFAADLDCLVCLLPDAPGTHGLVSAEVLAALKPTALLVNAGRGTVLDDGALVAALAAGTLGGAVLDVFREEPLPPGHPFWTAPNLVVTAHTAAPSVPEQIAALFVANYRRFLGGEPLAGEVAFDRGY